MLYFIGILAEFIMEILLELLFSLGFRRVNDVFKYPLITSILFGILSGLVSLIFFKELLISNPYLRIGNLLVTPLVIGLVMMIIGRLYDALGIRHSSLDNFISGFSFAMAMTLVRYIFSQ